VAVELVWTAFMLRRPWSMDDERLHAIVDHPPASHASILGDLLSIRFAEWIRRANVTMAHACVDIPPPDHGFEGLQEVFRSFIHLRLRYQARAVVAIHELSGLFEVEEPDADTGHETCRWRWMLYDYASVLDPQLHERLQALANRYRDEPKGAGEA
jgi:hypothetical protein